VDEKGAIVCIRELPNVPYREAGKCVKWDNSNGTMLISAAYDNQIVWACASDIWKAPLPDAECACNPHQTDCDLYHRDLEYIRIVDKKGRVRAIAISYPRKELVQEFWICRPSCNKGHNND